MSKEQLVDNIDVKNVEIKDIKEKYQEWSENIAKRNLLYVANKKAASQHCYPTDLGVWHIQAQVETFPSIAGMIKKAFPDKIFKTGIDIGCGTVTLFDHIKVEKPLLVDIVEDYCAFMRNRGHNVLKANIEDIPIEDNSMDIVVCSEILEHVLSLNTALSEVERILKKDGVFAVSVPWNQNIRMITLPDFSHIRTFNQGNLSARFCNWKIVDKQLLDGCPYGWLPTINLIMQLNK